MQETKHMTRKRWAQLLGALKSGDEAGYLDGFHIGNEESEEYRDVQLERHELQELLQCYIPTPDGMPNTRG